MSKLTDVPKRILIGRALRSDRLGETLLPKRIALPVFASDPLSSVAYAPGEVLLVLSVAGVSAYRYSPWIAAAVVVLMFTVVASYRQNVHAYPSGGGDYEVANTNLGPKAGLTVASALLVDYVLTVAVSIASGVENLGSAVPFVVEHKVLYDEGNGRAEVLDARGDRHGDREDVVDEQGARHGEAGLGPEVGVGDLVVTAAARVRVDVLPVRGDHGEHQHDDRDRDPGAEVVRRHTRDRKDQQYLARGICH